MPPQPKTWIVSLYGAEALAYALMVLVTPFFLRNVGLPSGKLQLFASILGLPWILRAFLAPFLEMLGSKRVWLLSAQCALCVLSAVLALGLESASVLKWVLLVLFFISIASVSHEIAADGIYFKLLGPSEQVRLLGWRIALQRVGSLVLANGILSYAGLRMRQGLTAESAWRITFGWIGLFFILFTIAQFFLVPASSEHPKEWKSSNWRARWLEVVQSFFRREGMMSILPFLLLFRIGESQLLHVFADFLTNDRALGGMGYPADRFSSLVSMIQPLSTAVGSIGASLWLARRRLEDVLVFVVLAMSLPHLQLISFSLLRPAHTAWIPMFLVMQGLASGLGLATTLCYLFRLSRGKFAMSYYSIGYGLITLGMVLPSLWGPFLQKTLGYPLFFAWIFFCSLPSLATAWVASKELRSYRA